MASSRFARRVGLLVFALGLTLSTSVLSEQPQKDRPAPETNTKDGTKVAREDAPDGPLAAIDRSLKAIAGNTSPHPDGEAQAARERQNRKDEIDAQQATARWAGLAVALGLFQLALGAYGTFLIWGTLKATRDAVQEANEATEAARESVRETSRVGEAQVRAYLSVIRAKYSNNTNVLSSIPDMLGDRHELVLELNNSGSTPAVVATIFCQCDIMTENEGRHFAVPVTVPYALSISNIPAGSTHKESVVARSIRLRYADLKEARAKVTDDTTFGDMPVLVIWGAVFYEDVFAKAFRSDFVFLLSPRDGMVDHELRLTATVQRVFEPMEDYYPIEERQ